MRDNRLFITRKQDNTVIEKLAAKRLSSILQPKKKLTNISSSIPIPYGILFMDQGRWLVVDQNGIKPPEGVYTFVRTLLGFIRVAPAPDGKTNHLVVADYAHKVRYAGVICFSLLSNNEAVLKFWNNESGGYRPSSKLAHLAGLPMPLFKPFSLTPNHTDSPKLEENKKIGSSKVAKEKISPLKMSKSISEPTSFKRFSLSSEFKSTLPKLEENKRLNPVLAVQEEASTLKITTSSSDPTGFGVNLFKNCRNKQHIISLKYTRQITL